ncbi:MAG: hypothetical protein JWR59_1380 [Brevundimonas sp.]|nr:hypothetical protein [Brevundimonas sp.]
MRSRLLLILSASAFVAGGALAQTPPGPAPGMQVAGVVKSVTPGQVTLATANGDVAIALDAKTRVMRREAGKVDEIKPGVYLGTSNLTAADGVSNTATEVHVMADGPNVHYPMDPKNNPALMMTNGHVKSVSVTDKGQEIDVDYGAAQTRHVVVAKSTAMTHITDLGLAGLKPGVEVSARTAAGPDGKPLAQYILVQEKK